MTKLPYASPSKFVSNYQNLTYMTIISSERCHQLLSFLQSVSLGPDPHSSLDFSGAATLARAAGTTFLTQGTRGNSHVLSREANLNSAGGMKQSTDRPGTLKATSSIVQASSIRVLVWLLAVSPNLKSVATERPECAIMIPSTGL